MQCQRCEKRPHRHTVSAGMKCCLIASHNHGTSFHIFIFRGTYLEQKIIPKGRINVLQPGEQNGELKSNLEQWAGADNRVKTATSSLNGHERVVISDDLGAFHPPAVFPILFGVNEAVTRQSKKQVTWHMCKITARPCNEMKKKKVISTTKGEKSCLSQCHGVPAQM